MDLYCVKCRAKTKTINETTTVTKNNRKALTRNCATCGTNFFRFIPSGTSQPKPKQPVKKQTKKTPVKKKQVKK